VVEPQVRLERRDQATGDSVPSVRAVTEPTLFSGGPVRKLMAALQSQAADRTARPHRSTQCFYSRNSSIGCISASAEPNSSTTATSTRTSLRSTCCWRATGRPSPPFIQSPLRGSKRITRFSILCWWRIRST
jgi:hypothetical protein